MDKNKCNSCGKPKCSCKNKEFTKAVIEIDNPEQTTLMRKVTIPASMGDDTTVPPVVGKYHNVLLYYEANQKSYLYSSDGIPTQLVNGVTDYEQAVNLPQINGVTLLGDKSSADLKLADAPMVITVANGNTSWSGADTAEDVYNFFLNKGKVNIVFSGGENYAYEIASAGYIEDEGKLLCVVVAASTQNTGGVTDFDGNALFGTMTLYTADKAIDVSQIELQPKLYITDFTGLNLNYNELSGLPATAYSIGMVKPGDGLEVTSDGTLSISEIEQYAHFFDTVADMKAATNLKAGDYARTGGFHTINDGGGALYKITDTGAANEMDVIAVGDLYASLIMPTTVTPEMFGAYGDGAHDDTLSCQRAINLNYNILFRGQYSVTYLILKSGIRLTGMGETTISTLSSHWALFSTDSVEDVKIEGIRFIGVGDYYASSMGSDQTKDAGVVISSGNNVTIDSCKFTNFGSVAIQVKADNVVIQNNYVYSNLDYSSGGTPPKYSFGINVDGDNIHIENNRIIGYIQGIINGANTGNLYIESNLVSQRYQHGIYLSSGTNIVISNNIINSDNTAICGVKLQTNTAEQRIYNVTITDNILKSGASNGAQGILISSYSTALYPISKVVIANNSLVGDRGVEAQNVEDLIINGNTIETVDSSGAYGIRLLDSALTNNPSAYKHRIYNNTITSTRPISTEYLSARTYPVILDISGNEIYVPKSSIVISRQAVYPDYLTECIIRNNYLNCEDTSDPNYGQTDGVLFNVQQLDSIVLMGNCTKTFKWGCRNLSAYDASKIINVGNSFNTSLNIS